MADLLLKGVSLPEKGFIKIGIDADGTLTLIGRWNGSLYIPEGKEIGKAVVLEDHGRLIDASPFDVVVFDNKSDDFITGAEYILGILDDLPTVVEASGR